MKDKKLSEMTLEELWQLFPIQLTPPNINWTDWYDEESCLLKKRLPVSVSIHHIGSTAVGRIWAKPIIDILVEADNSDFYRIHQTLLSLDYLCMNQEKTSADYNKGYTENGFAERIFHLHLRIFGNNDELYFRDFLKDHPDIAVQYETLKISLWKKFEHNRDEYTNQKGDFIRFYTREARRLYDERYDQSSSQNRSETF